MDNIFILMADFDEPNRKAKAFGGVIPIPEEAIKVLPVEKLDAPGLEVIKKFIDEAQTVHVFVHSKGGMTRDDIGG